MEQLPITPHCLAPAAAALGHITNVQLWQTRVIRARMTADGATAPADFSD